MNDPDEKKKRGLWFKLLKYGLPTFLFFSAMIAWRLLIWQPDMPEISSDLKYIRVDIADKDNWYLELKEADEALDKYKDFSDKPELLDQYLHKPDSSIIKLRQAVQNKKAIQGIAIENNRDTRPIFLSAHMSFLRLERKILQKHCEGKNWKAYSRQLAFVQKIRQSGSCYDYFIAAYYLSKSQQQDCELIEKHAAQMPAAQLLHSLQYIEKLPKLKPIFTRAYQLHLKFNIDAAIQTAKNNKHDDFELDIEEFTPLMKTGLIAEQLIQINEGLIANLDKPYTQINNPYPQELEYFRQSYWFVITRPSETANLLYLKECERALPYQNSFITCKSWKRLTALKLALMLYRSKHNSYPDKLEQLVPDFMHKLPRDPYTGEAPIYDPKRQIVYFREIDGKDNKGRRTYSSTKDEADFVLALPQP